jgi:hypothetical protein
MLAAMGNWESEEQEIGGDSKHEVRLQIEECLGEKFKCLQVLR